MALGLAVACSIGVATPSVAAAPGQSPSVRAAAPGADDPHKAKKQVDKEIEALKDELEDTSASLKNAYIALRRTQAAIPVAQAAVDKAEAEVSKADAYNDEMAVQLDVARANEARAVDELAATRKKLAETRTRVARFASQLYQDQGMGQLSVALSATTPDDFANRIAMNDTVMDVQNQSLSRLATARAAATAQEAHIKALKVQVEAAKKQAEAALAKAEKARAAAAAAKQKLEALAAQQAGPVAGPRGREGGREDEARRRPEGAGAAEGSPRGAGQGRQGSSRSSRRSPAPGRQEGPEGSLDVDRLPVPPVRGLDLLRVRHALPPDPALLAAARRA